MEEKLSHQQITANKRDLYSRGYKIFGVPVANSSKITEEMVLRYFDLVRQTGKVTTTCKLAGLTHTGFTTLARRHPEMRLIERRDAAKREFYEEHILPRAIEWATEPVVTEIRKNKNGEVIGTTERRDPNIMRTLLMMGFPEARGAGKQEIDINHNMPTPKLEIVLVSKDDRKPFVKDLKSGSLDEDPTYFGDGRSPFDQDETVIDATAVSVDSSDESEASADAGASTKMPGDGA